MYEEPEIKHEKDFQAAINDMLKEYFAQQSSNFFTVEKFGLDLAIFSKQDVKFIEVKVFTLANGRVGIGDKNGGNQIGLLRGQQDSKIDTEKYVRWALCDASEKKGERRFYIFSNRDIIEKKLFMGNQIENGKQNNLEMDKIKKELQPYRWLEFCKELQNFLRL